MQEYWVNVYTFPLTKDHQFIGGKYDSVDGAMRMAAITGDCVYRLHVKLKPKAVKLPGYKKYRITDFR